MQFDKRQMEEIKVALEIFFRISFSDAKTMEGTKPDRERIEEILQPLFGDFDVRCGFGSGGFIDIPYIVFCKKEWYEPQYGVYPRIAVHRKEANKIEVSIVESANTKVPPYAAQTQIIKYNTSGAYFTPNALVEIDYEAIINKLAKDMDFFLNIKDEDLPPRK